MSVIFGICFLMVASINNVQFMKSIYHTIARSYAVEKVNIINKFSLLILHYFSNTTTNKYQDNPELNLKYRR